MADFELMDSPVIGRHDVIGASFSPLEGSRPELLVDGWNHRSKMVRHEAGVVPGVHGLARPPQQESARHNIVNQEEADTVREAAGTETGAKGLDLDAWRNDLRCLHQTLDKAVHSFITSQTRQLSGVAAELALRKEKVWKREQQFTELANSIAAFVEEEAQRFEVPGSNFADAEADARHSAYDAGLPGSQVLHRINRLWRKAMHAFEATRASNARDHVLAQERHQQDLGQALDKQRSEMEAVLMGMQQRSKEAEEQHCQEVAALTARLEQLTSRGEQKAEEATGLASNVEALREQLAASNEETSILGERLRECEAARLRADYEHGVERDELARTSRSAEGRLADLQGSVDELKEREKELLERCADQSSKLEQMKQMMEDQELEVANKLERVQQYLKERTTGALHAEKQQKDAERTAERWQSEVRRLQSDKERLSRLVMELEGQKANHEKALQATRESMQVEITSLKESMTQRRDPSNSTNRELTQRHEDEYEAKLQMERQREKERSIALLKKKEQEILIKDQQLKAARQQVQELEQMLGNTASGGAASASPNSRKSMNRCGDGGAGALPPLPLSAR